MTLRVTDVKAGYGQLEILQGVSLLVPAAAIVGIIGPNGAGKSTLLKTIFGYLRPHQGEVMFGSESLIGRGPHQVMRRGIGFVAQASGLFAEMTVDENLMLGGYSLGSRTEMSGAREVVYERFPFFRDRRRQIAGSLSGGEQRLLAIARTLITRPRLILLDEPSAALSPRYVDLVYQTVEELNKSGIALLIVEQNVEAVLKISHRVFVLDLGKNAFDGTPEELRDSDRIRRLYLGEDHSGISA